MIRRPPRSTLFPYTNALPILELRHTSMNTAFPFRSYPASKWFVPSCRCARGVPPVHNRFPCRMRSEAHTSELQSQSNLVCRLLLEKQKKTIDTLRVAYTNADV